MLHEFLTSKREEIIARTKMKVAAGSVLRAPETGFAHGLPLFLDQVIETLKHSAGTSEEMKASATKHGDEMLRMGYTVAQVVQDYGDACQAVTELAFELDAAITVDEFNTLDRCLTDAIAQAVTEYARLRERSLLEQGTERVGTLVHEMRNRLSAVTLSFSRLKGGAISINGSTGAVLDRSLKGLTDLIDRSLNEIRLRAPIQKRETIELAQFVEEIEVAALMEATNRGLELTVEPIEVGIAIDADRQLLAAAVANLLQNAFKFTREHGRVRLLSRATADRVLIDVEDECGGLPSGQVEALFLPFHQRSADRTGLGLGLSISRTNVQLNGGEIRVRDVPGTGCIFTIDLPRVSG